MIVDAFESLAPLGTPRRPKKAALSEEILRKGLGDMGSCPIPRELWERIVPAGVLERLRGVRLPEGKGYPSPATEVMVEVLKGQGVFFEVQGEQGGPDYAHLSSPRMT